ncbi:MAG TPA: hypothetical protein VGQ26_18790 [Streptosporangiaceae bacterium]|nr:hypothetical protein [Streptosporangiaceae bacterium]
MTPRDPAQSTPAGKAGDDFQKIAGIGAGIERRLHSADILTYHDLAARSPEEIAASLAGMAGLSAARIASQDWVGQARQLAGSTGPPLPSEPDQHYASFHIELLLDVDNSVRRTKVHHYQSGTDEAWAGWDEDRLLALLRSHIPPAAPRQPAEASDSQSPAPTTTIEPEMARSSGEQRGTADLAVGLAPSSVRVANLGLTHEGRTSHRLTPGESTSVGFILGVSRTTAPQAATLDFTADVMASSVLGDDQRWPLGTVRGAVRVDEPLSVELAGPPLPRGLYRLEATVRIYPAGHAPESQPLGSRRAAGAVIQVS